MLNAVGKLRYSPEKPGVKKRNNPWWIVVDVDKSIADYYRWWVSREILSPPWAVNGIRLQPPMWGAHITVLDGRHEVEVSKKHLWGKYQNELISFEYSPVVEQHWKFWVIPVQCQRLVDIRGELGFDVNYPFHITVGRQE